MVGFIDGIRHTLGLYFDKSVRSIAASIRTFFAFALRNEKATGLQFRPRADTRRHLIGKTATD